MELEKPDNQTPMMKQYREIKKNYSDSILFFRMGDFYEMFERDAEIASKALSLTLTARNKNSKENIPLCGLPYHAADTYIARLIRQGFKVAICEQVEDPKLAKGIVKREVIRVITPGTVMDTNLLQEKENNYLMAIYPGKNKIGLSMLDISTGEFLLTEYNGQAPLEKLHNELSRLEPKEVLIPPLVSDNQESRTKNKERIYSDEKLVGLLRQFPHVSYNFLDEGIFDYASAYQRVTEYFHTTSLEGFGCEGLRLATSAAAAVLYYVQETQKSLASHINKLSVYNPNNYMLLDSSTQQNLELTKTTRDQQKAGSLLSVLDQTVTAMGGRLLKNWLLHPLLDMQVIKARQEAVGYLKDNLILRAQLREGLQEIYDLERLVSRISLAIANARDLIALKTSIKKIPAIKTLLNQTTAPLILDILDESDELQDISFLIENSIIDEPPFTLREGGLIKPGINGELDDLKSISRDGKGWIANLEGKERQRTGINSLKVRFNKVFGYYIEITNTNLHLAPADYTRKQTLSNAERFITPELKEYETKVLGAEEKIVELEYQLFCQTREKITQEISRIQMTAQAIAQVDALFSLAEVAAKNNYVKPVMEEDNIIKIIEGRHPVLEQIAGVKFIPNDTYLDNEENRLSIITGPNMAGKSTYIRQVALISLMAQLGSFVPAKEANLGIVDRIFSRVGASDNLLKGQSTFMVEMNETANILNNATSKSLIILDEIGRGTSTFDGISIAWAIGEYIHDKDKIGAKTLFATHYHELTDLALTLKGVKNYNIAVREVNEEIIFLRKILPGGADRSYGIQVARLAGLPKEIISRAKEILADLEQAELNGIGRHEEEGAIAKNEERKTKNEKQVVLDKQLSFFSFEPHPVVGELKEIDINSLTPLQALNKLAELKGKVK
ncbi:MAG: DNA mismatch repair protein MutS [bacterium]